MKPENKTNEPSPFIVHALLLGLAAAMLCGCHSPAKASVSATTPNVFNVEPVVTLAARIEFEIGGNHASR